MSPKRQMRNYKESDASVLNKARYLVDQLDKNFEEFNRFDPDSFSSCFPQRLKEKIGEIEKSPTENTIKDLLAANSEKIEQCLNSCLGEMHLARYFVKKICKNDKGLIELFCYQEMQDNYNDSEKALTIFGKFVKQVERQWEQLSAAHYPDVNLAKLQQLYKEFEDAHNAQYHYKKECSSAKVERIEQLNDLWKEMKDVQQVAVNFLYKKQPEMQALFTF